MKAPFIIYADLEPFLEKMNTCHNNSKNSWTTKINTHTHSGYPLFTNYSCDATKKNKLDCYKGKDCMKNFCIDLRKHATKLINYDRKEMIPLTNEERKLYHKQKICYIFKERFSTGDDNKKSYKFRDHCHYTGKYRGAAHDIRNLRYNTQKEIPVVFHNGST